ncbi:MAG TPA: iron-sulfur cluster assembly scaffold protein [Methylomirabilota bacterium]|jgi:nitrogen fixation NifU-like protein|nr:iron-sulfur cluster assembly scaffold protein [Methylomirabilota bacterium]
MAGALYGGVILDRFRHPRFFGELPGADLVHEDVNPLCGDRLRVEVRLGPGGELETVRFQGDACAIATASADLLAEMVEGRPARDASEVDREAILGRLGAPVRPSRLACVNLPVGVLRGALRAIGGGPGPGASPDRARGTGGGSR